MDKLWQVLKGHPKPALSEKVQRGDQGKFFKNRPKSSPRFKGPKTLWSKWHYPLISMHLNCKNWKKNFGANSGSKSTRMATLWQFLEGHPKPACSEKKQRGDQEKLLKNRPKSTPRFKGPRALWRKCHYPVICIHLYCKDWRRFWRTRRL